MSIKKRQREQAQIERGKQALSTRQELCVLAILLKRRKSFPERANAAIIERRCFNYAAGSVISMQRHSSLPSSSALFGAQLLKIAIACQARCRFFHAADVTRS
jgi:hypothetical protein